jgi:hypothetical protein
MRAVLPAGAALVRAPPEGRARSPGRCELAARYPGAHESLSQPLACQATRLALVPRPVPVEHCTINRSATRQSIYFIVSALCSKYDT